jgi:hypothetical protein
VEERRGEKEKSRATGDASFAGAGFTGGCFPGSAMSLSKKRGLPPPRTSPSTMHGVSRGLRPITKRAVKAATKNAALFNGARTLVSKAAAPSLAQAATLARAAPKAGAGKPSFRWPFHHSRKPAEEVGE